MDIISWLALRCQPYTRIQLEKEVNMNGRGVNLRDKRIGEQKANNNGNLMTIIDYKNSNNMVVEFKETGYKTKCSYIQFKKRTLKDKTLKTIYDTGCIGATSIMMQPRTKKPSYVKWEDMLKRCYHNNKTSRQKTYADCSVCDEWLCYANFEKWYDENYYNVNNETMCLDKDILVKDNRIYSPETSIFVPERINLLFVKPSIKREYPIGVYCRKDNVVKRFSGRIKECNGKNTTKAFRTPKEAFLFYKENKGRIIKEVADEYKDKIPRELYDAMYAYEVEITD